MTTPKRLQILLDEPQFKRLQRAAHQLHATKTALIREGINLVLQKKVARTEDPLLDLIGQAGAAGNTSISENHDEFLLKTEQGRWHRKSR